MNYGWLSVMTRLMYSPLEYSRHMYGALVLSQRETFPREQFYLHLLNFRVSVVPLLAVVNGGALDNSVSHSDE